MTPRAGKAFRTSQQLEDLAVRQRHAAGIDVHAAVHFVAVHPQDVPAGFVNPEAQLPPGVRKFVVEFLGGPLTNLPYGVAPQMEVSASRGRLTDYRFVEPVPDGVAGHWRAHFDLADTPGSDPVELRLQLLVAGRPATETWLYQYHPFISGT